MISKFGNEAATRFGCQIESLEVSLKLDNEKVLEESELIPERGLVQYCLQSSNLINTNAKLDAAKSEESVLSCVHVIPDPSTSLTDFVHKISISSSEFEDLCTRDKLKDNDNPTTFSFKNKSGIKEKTQAECTNNSCTQAKCTNNSCTQAECTNNSCTEDNSCFILPRKKVSRSRRAEEEEEEDDFSKITFDFNSSYPTLQFATDPR